MSELDEVREQVSMYKNYLSAKEKDLMIRSYYVNKFIRESLLKELTKDK